jgi:hypothetical protein
MAALNWPTALHLLCLVDLLARLPQERGRGGYALVVSTENITQNWYHGIECSMLIPNTIFRMGSGGQATCMCVL